MSANLIIEEGDPKGFSLSLENEDSWVIGGDPDSCNLVIEDPLVSLKHLLVRQTPGGLEIENLSLFDPAFVNEEELTEKPRLLHSGDKIKIGNTTLRFNEEPVSENSDEAPLSEAKTSETSEKSEDSESTGSFDELPSEDEFTPLEKFSESEEIDEISEIPENQDQESGKLSDNVDETESPAENENDRFSPKEPLPGNEPETSGLEESNLPSDDIREPEYSSPAFDRSDVSRPSRYDTIFEEEEVDQAKLAEIDFGIAETGRWLLKVIGGPNNGAEFYMQTGSSYIIGTDPHSCDIVFHDTSVSRQHAKITVTPEESLSIEDMGSRNGVIIEGSPIQEPRLLGSNTIVTLGTTSFVVYDREGEMHTIISPLLPSLVKALQQEDVTKTETESSDASVKDYTANYVPGEDEQPGEPKNISPSSAMPSSTTGQIPRPSRNLAPYIFLAFIVGLFLFAGVGTIALFKAEPIEVVRQENGDELIGQVLSSFPAVNYTYNKSNSSLLLIGHVATPADKTQLLYQLQTLKFIKSIDDSGIVIDEYVWQELNSILAKNPAWKGMTIYSPAAGEFILSGYLNTRKQAEELSSYMSLTFPYIDLLKKQIVVEEDVLSQVNTWLQTAGLTGVTPKISNGSLNLVGSAPTDKLPAIAEIIEKIKQIPGLRNVNNYVRGEAQEMGREDISDAYKVTGKSRVGDKLTIVINGRILSEGDSLDGMDITKITSGAVLLERGDKKYRIDY